MSGRPENPFSTQQGQLWLGDDWPIKDPGPRPLDYLEGHDLSSSGIELWPGEGWIETKSPRIAVNARKTWQRCQDWGETLISQFGEIEAFVELERQNQQTTGTCRPTSINVIEKEIAFPWPPLGDKLTTANCLLYPTRLGQNIGLEIMYHLPKEQLPITNDLGSLIIYVNTGNKEVVAVFFNHIRRGSRSTLESTFLDHDLPDDTIALWQFTHPNAYCLSPEPRPHLFHQRTQVVIDRDTVKGCCQIMPSGRVDYYAFTDQNGEDREGFNWPDYATIEMSQQELKGVVRKIFRFQQALPFKRDRELTVPVLPP